MAGNSVGKGVSVPEAPQNAGTGTKHRLAYPTTFLDLETLYGTAGGVSGTFSAVWRVSNFFFGCWVKKTMGFLKINF